jgi:DNA-binding MarR family transcriptional regulator
MIREQLKLENQLCFPVYAASRLIIRIYQPYLDDIGITYPQYLVLLVLWEKDEVTVNEISRKLILNTNTTTPLLKRLETLGLVTRRRSGEDERKVIIALTAKGKKLQSRAADIPGKLSEGLTAGSMSIADLIDLKDKLHAIIDYLSKKPG